MPSTPVPAAPNTIASLSDIARRAGVSIATASRALNGSTHPVSEATRASVLAAADELGYSPSALGRALVTRSSRIIGVIVGDIVDPYFAEIASGVEDVAGRQGYLTMVCTGERETAKEAAHLQALRDYHAAGIVFASSGYADDTRAAALARSVSEAREAGSTVVSLAPREFESVTLTVDNRAAAYDITDYVASLGHRDIRFVEGPEKLLTSRLRHAGFRAAMADAGLAETPVIAGGFSYEAGIEAAALLVAGGPLPDAVVAVNDEVAIGLLTGLRQAGIDVPGQISVAGIDDTRPARFVELTTVNVPLRDLGAAAAAAVLAEGQNGAVGDRVLPHRLVPRRTTARRPR
jgi:LacI family transcriptional regulator